MQNIAHGIWKLFREVMQKPVSLEQRLRAPGALQFKLTPKRSADLGDLTRWNNWLDDLVTDGCPWDRRVFQSYGPLSTAGAVENFTCSIRDIEGLAGSKGPIDQHTDLDDVAIRATDLARVITPAKLQENLQWTGNTREPTIDRWDLRRYLWDGRIFWMNSDGSHHFMAARFLAGRLGIPIMMKPRTLYTYAIHTKNLHALLADWDVFALHDIFTEKLVVGGNAPEQRMPSIHDLLKTTSTPHHWARMPPPHTGVTPASTGTAQTLEQDRENGKTALFLPRSDRRSARAAALFRQVYAFDLGAYLRGLCDQQSAHARTTNSSE